MTDTKRKYVRRKPVKPSGKPKTGILPIRIPVFKIEQLQMKFPGKVSPKVAALIDAHLLNKEKQSNFVIASKIYERLVCEGAELGNASILIIEDVLNEC